MKSQEFTVEDLKRILSEAAGGADRFKLTEDILDIGFEALGYESVALLETGSRIEREYGISLDDSALIDARTPRALLAVVNAGLADLAPA